MTAALVKRRSRAASRFAAYGSISAYPVRARQRQRWWPASRPPGGDSAGVAHPEKYYSSIISAGCSLFVWRTRTSSGISPSTSSAAMVIAVGIRNHARLAEDFAVDDGVRAVHRRSGVRAARREPAGEHRHAPRPRSVDVTCMPPRWPERCRARRWSRRRRCRAIRRAGGRSCTGRSPAGALRAADRRA